MLKEYTSLLQILLEIEQDEDILHDDLADLVEEESPVLEPQQSAKTGGNNMSHSMRFSTI